MFRSLTTRLTSVSGMGTLASSLPLRKLLKTPPAAMEPNMISQKAKCLPPGIQQYLHEKLPSYPSDCKDLDGNRIARKSEYMLYEAASDFVAHCSAMGGRRM
jgi:hypothetical protein